MRLDTELSYWLVVHNFFKFSSISFNHILYVSMVFLSSLYWTKYVSFPWEITSQSSWHSHFFSILFQTLMFLTTTHPSPDLLFKTRNPRQRNLSLISCFTGQYLTSWKLCQAVLDRSSQRTVHWAESLQTGSLEPTNWYEVGPRCR